MQYYLPDEAYLPTPSEYERHYHMLVREVEQALGPFFGALPGPHPEVCRQCAEKGECVCGAPFLWIDTPGNLLFLAAKRLQEYEEFNKERHHCLGTSNNNGTLYLD